MSNQQVSSIHTGRRRPSFQLHHRLGLAMDEAQIKPAVMAAFLKVSTGTISNYVNGHTTPGYSTIARWADKCDVETDWLEEGDGPAGPPAPVASEVPPTRSGWNVPGATLHALRTAC
ncbi:MAG: helix-turn-helix domain-containing protein [Acidimicrobiales bacterium]